MRMHIVTKPRKIETREGKEVYVYTDDSNYSDAFGYEWKEYSRTYTDSTLGENVSLARLELNLGFPVEFLRGMTVLELGSGQGRFTEHLAAHAKTVVTVDMSEAIYTNIVLTKDNVIPVRADINALPEFSEKFDLVFCRGVIQHTKDPKETIASLFTQVKEGGLVIFDVYKKDTGFRIHFKYFWRPVVQFFFTEEKFDALLKRHTPLFYKLHHICARIINVHPIVKQTLGRLPLCYNYDWDKQYPQLSQEVRYQLFRNEYIDMLYSGYDQPMSPEEVIHTLASLGQIPYSYDPYRNHFRVKHNPSRSPITVSITKNGVIPKK
jgi:2-polyprenyl-3-methyl-5-hydroxy-6-metoxy-1,4-benzoquinol methylase